jgi:hypothetical protein
MEEHFDLVQALMDFEEGNLTPEDSIYLFSQLIKTGTVHKLQGRYGRIAAHLVEQGFLDPEGNILQEIPS